MSCVLNRNFLHACPEGAPHLRRSAAYIEEAARRPDLLDVVKNKLLDCIDVINIAVSGSIAASSGAAGSSAA